MALRALSALAACGLLVAVATADDGDVIAARAGGVFELVQDASDSSLCAGRVNHRGDWKESKTPGVWELAHSGIDHVASTCTGEGALRIYGGGAAPKNVVDVASSEGLKGAVSAGALWAGDGEGRECEEWRVPSGSVFAFVSAAKKPLEVEAVSGGGKLPAGRDYMLAIYAGVGKASSPVCVYSKDSTALSLKGLKSAANSTSPEDDEAQKEKDNSNLVPLPGVGSASKNGSASGENSTDTSDGTTVSGPRAEDEGFFSKGRNIGIIAGIGVGVVALFVTAFCCVCVRRRSGSGSDGDYYKFEGGSARNSGSVAENRATPWGARRSGKKLPDLEGAELSDPPSPVVRVSRSGNAMRSNRSNSMDSGESVDSGGIAAPMMDTMEARSLSAINHEDVLYQSKYGR